MYIETLYLSKFRAFNSFYAKLNYPQPQIPNNLNFPNVNLLIGNNGSGKTSCLQALCIMFLSPILNNSGFQTDYLIRRPLEFQKEVDRIHSECGIIAIYRNEIGSGQLHCQTIISMHRDSDTEIISNLWHSNDLYQNNNPEYFICAYGANRRMERPTGYSEGNRLPRYQRVASIFEDHVGLVPFTYGFLTLSESEEIDHAIEILNGLLPDDVQLTKERDSQNRPLFHVKNSAMLPVNALSDGYRTFIAWVWDMLFQMNAVTRKSDIKDFREIEGIVIVDEIDLFLHPEWQRTVVKSVAEMFPKIQFLFSTHSPIVAGTLQPENIFVLETEPDGSSVVKQYQENIYGLTANQILTSSYFGLESTRAPGTGTLADMVARMPDGTKFLDSLIKEK
jgi:AAA domain, putative AbiEii toxin, Type IV TA system